MTTPLGNVDVYRGHAEIIVTVESNKPIDTSGMRALVQVQACKDEICYPPSQIARHIVEAEHVTR